MVNACFVLQDSGKAICLLLVSQEDELETCSLLDDDFLMCEHKLSNMDCALSVAVKTPEDAHRNHHILWYGLKSKLHYPETLLSTRTFVLTSQSD